LGALLASLALAQAGDAFSQDQKMYQWTDQDGVVHFSDMAPEGQDVQARDLPEDVAPATASPYQGASEPSAAQQRREEIARNTEAAKVKQATRAAECAAWQTEVDRLEPRTEPPRVLYQRAGRNRANGRRSPHQPGSGTQSANRQKLQVRVPGMAGQAGRLGIVTR
jgi:hypothetical protein